MSVFVQLLGEVVLPDADTQILAVNTGKLHVIGVVGNVRTYTLPAVAQGLHYRFQIGSATVAHAVTIAAGAAIINGLITTLGVTAITLGCLAVAAQTDIIFGTTAILGDYVDLTCDGVHWSVSSMSRINVSITSA